MKRKSNECKFTEEQEIEYLNKDRNYNMSVDGNFYVCHSCSRQINAKKKPKRNDREFLQYYDFPEELLKEMKEKCSPAEKLQNQRILPEELRVAVSLTSECRPNRLENFILKLIIPFIRIANCKMGRYFKVQGNLILISSDIEHSLEKILPLEQKIIPVSLKRKLSYKGFYIEEYVDKEKVQIFLDWFKANNTLYKDVEFYADRIGEFEENITEGIN